MSAAYTGKPKRSISSTLASLFSKNADENNEDLDGRGPGDGDISDSGSVVIKRQKGCATNYEELVWNDERIPDHLPNHDDNDNRPNIFLYEGDSEYDLRPPVLTIEPKQRLRLLRMQQLRRARQFPLLQRYIQSAENELCRLTDGKTTSAREKFTSRLQSNKVNLHASDKPKAKRWKADFQYDLSEYELLKNDNKVKPLSSSMNSLDSPKLAHPLLKRSASSKKQITASDQSVTPTGSGLTDVQKKLLQGKAFSKDSETKQVASTAALSLKPVVKESIFEDKAIHVNEPSLGFDFINNDNTAAIPDNTDTPSKPAASKSLPFGNPQGGLFGSKKVQNVTTDSSAESEELPRKKRDFDNSGDSAKQFSIGNSDQNVAKTALPKIGFSFGANENKVKADDSHISANKEKKPAIGSPAFSFGSVLSTNKGSKEENNSTSKTLFGKLNPTSEKSSEKALPSFRFSGTDKIGSLSQEASNPIKFGNTSGVSKTAPAFSFGNSQETKKVENANGTPAPAFSFNGAKSSTSEPTPLSTSQEADSSKPLFQFGASADIAPAKADPHEKKTEGNVLPSFSFGAKPVSEKSTENFKSSNNDRPSDENSLNKPSFPFSLPPIENKKALEESSETKKIKNDTLGGSVKPAFSFGSGEATSSESTKPLQFSGSSTSAPDVKPSFTFGGNPAAINSNTDGKDAVPSFSFGTANKTLHSDANSKPTFSFGGSAAVAKPADEKPASITPMLGSQTSNSQQDKGKFKFDLGGFKSENRQTTPTPFSDNSNAGSVGGSNASVGFSFGNPPQSAQNKITSTQPTQNGFNFTEQNQKPFAFTGSGPSTTNNSPAFGASSNQPNVPFTFGGSSASSTPQVPPLGGGFGSTMQSNTFHPSTAANFNFGGQPSQTPSLVFGSQTPQPNPPSMFSSGTQNPSTIFNAQASTPQGGGQFPPERRIAMPGRRRRRG
ncbi:unnamed protein product [Kluyveromyces dobzhanskii CBS 2104]|uniref:WGS project CCBQ000000000 data, contig 00015 n=1 Tax=Kluyveromyces dobzhanskii CBS 2104 TaxID=1427455 RepID=A0A0A8L8P3_9SACH|nr:unnamed protein product [Kluyveromyces dobzhanskii CBS 2104]